MHDINRKYGPRIGEILLDYGLITKEQLSHALNIQIQKGGRLGSILEEVGYLSSDTLTGILGRQYNTPFLNLCEVKVPQEVLRLLPFEQIKSMNVLPFRKTDDTVSVAMVDPDNKIAIHNIETAVGSPVRPFVVSSYQMGKAISMFEKEGYGDAVFDGARLVEKGEVIKTSTPNMTVLLKLLSDFNATDLHLTAGAQPCMRIKNEIKRLSMPVVTPAQMRDFISEILTKDRLELIEKEKELDFVLSLSNIGRFRINIYRQRNSISLSARLIFENIPSLNELSLPEWLSDYAISTQGIILIAGLAGQGKTTTIASFVDMINSSRKCNIVTLEDPIEYLHRHKKSNVNQREIGIDTGSLNEGLQYVIRQDPDVVVISELRDPENIAIALNAAESGRLVITSVPSINATATLERMINVFPVHQQPQIRMQLADTLLLILAQKLIPARDGEGKIPAYEKLTNSKRVSNLIKTGNIDNIKTIIQGRSEDMSSMDQCIARLCLENRITYEEGHRFADNSSYYQELVRIGRRY